MQPHDGSEERTGPKEPRPSPADPNFDEGGGIGEREVGSAPTPRPPEDGGNTQ